MPKCKCRVGVGVECGSEVVKPRLHILNICEDAVGARYSKGQSAVLLILLWQKVNNGEAFHVHETWHNRDPKSCKQKIWLILRKEENH